MKLHYIIYEIKRIIRKYHFLYLTKRKISSQGTNLDKDRQLYKTIDGLLLYLNQRSSIDLSIRKLGLWEEKTTLLIKKLVPVKGIVLDVGANNGYFTTLMAKLVGTKGYVYSFEPTTTYFKVLSENVRINELKNVSTFKIGLSDKNQELVINIDNSTATIHQPIVEYIVEKESISLNSLDSWVDENDIKQIDLIKVDIDGHEPFFVEGAINSIKKFKPVIILEVSNLHYLEAGVMVWDFYHKLKDLGLRIYSEYNSTEITTKTDFLINCCNFAYSTNIILSYKQLYLEL
jgi:FkbM family methyltransferase